MEKKTTSVINTNLSKLEQERFFGEGVDIFKSYHACNIIGNILARLGLRFSKDSDWNRAVANYVTDNEISFIYDKIIPPERREAAAESRRMRSAPELGDDDPDDIIYFLTKKLVHRKKLWIALAKCYERRIKEFEEVMANKNREISAVEMRFNELKTLFDLSDLEVAYYSA